MPPHQPPFAPDALPVPFLRKKRILLVLLTGFVTVFLYFRSSSSPASASLDELQGLLYMVSNTETILPHDLDLSKPIAPSTWVPRESFNGKLWKDRIERLDKDTPVIVFSKSYCPYSRRAKDLLSRYALEPAPHIVEVDLRDDADFIKGLLIRLTRRSTFPNVIVRGKSLGGYDNLHALHTNGNLEHELERAGVKVTGNIQED